MQKRQPMQRCQSIMTMPSSRRKVALVGHTRTQGGLLLQIFTETVIGPVFFEVIQRKGDEGFGEGNFRALFESIELDQVRRGVLGGSVTEENHTGAGRRIGRANHEGSS